MDELDQKEFKRWILDGEIIKYGRIGMIAYALNLLMVSDDLYIRAWINRVIDKNPKAMQDLKNPKKSKKTREFLIGQVMRISNNKANPDVTRKLMEDLL